MAETERIDQPKQASQDEAPRMDCPTCHVSHVGPTAEALQLRLGSVERDERLSELLWEGYTAADCWRDNGPAGGSTLDPQKFATWLQKHGVRVGGTTLGSQGAVPSPDGPPLTKAAIYARTALEDACRLIELGDERLLASDGPAGGQPPELSLAEWRALYVTLDKARKRLWTVAALSAGPPPDAPEVRAAPGRWRMEAMRLREERDKTLSYEYRDRMLERAEALEKCADELVAALRASPPLQQRIP